jgi:hypothetical protein
MKTKLTILSFMLLINFSVSAASNPESAAVDDLVRTYQIPLEQDEIAKLPIAIVCAKGLASELSIENLKNISATENFQPVRLRTNDSKTGLIIDWSDGDQVGGLFVETKDLKNLIQGLTQKIQAKTYNGFWYKDGDHYELSDTECELLK